MHLLKEFEKAPNSVGSVSTQIWLNHYLSFIALQVKVIVKTIILKVCFLAKFI